MCVEDGFANGSWFNVSQIILMNNNYLIIKLRLKDEAEKNSAKLWQTLKQSFEFNLFLSITLDKSQEKFQKFDKHSVNQPSKTL